MMSNLDLSGTYSKLCFELNALSLLLRHTPHRYAEVAEIAPVPKGEENEEIHNVTVNPVTDESAKILGAKCFQDLLIKENFSQKSARRTVGALVFRASTPAAEKILDKIQTVNALKASIESHVVNEHADRTARFQALHNACPGVMTLHLYRQIRYITEPLTLVSFYWQQKDSLYKPDKDKLLDRIKKECRLSGGEHKVPLQMLIEKINAVEPDNLRCRRRLKIQAAVNLNFVSGKPKTFAAPMPIVLFQDGPIDIKMLSHYDKTNSRKPRSDRSKAETIGYFNGEEIEAV